MWRFKMCPRCEGDIFIDKEISTWYEKCLQCACQHELKNLEEFKKQATQRELEPVRVGQSRPKK